MKTACQTCTSKIVWSPAPHHRLVRRIARLKRCLLGTPTPTLVKDLIKVFREVFGKLFEKPFESLNFLALVPTAIALLVAPRHFFRRLSRIKDRKIPPYVTPLHYAWYSIVFTVFMAYVVYPNLPGSEYVGQYLHGRVPKWTTYLLLLLFSLLLPLWMVPTSWTLLQAYRLIALLWLQTAPLIHIPILVSAHAKTFKPDFRTLFPDFRTLFSVPLNPLEVFKHVDCTNFAYGLCYLGMTSFLMFHVVGMAIVASYYGFLFYTSNILVFFASWPEVFVYIAPPFALVLCMLLPLALAGRLLVQPYVELIRWTQRTPFFKIQLNDFEEIQLAFHNLLASLEPRSLLAGLERVGRPDAGNSHVRFDELLPPRTIPTKEISAPILQARRTLPSAVLLMSEEQRDCVYRAALECCAALLRLMSFWKSQDFDLRNCNNRAAFLEARQQACRDTLPLERIKELLNHRSLEERTAGVLQCVLSQLNDKLAIANS